MWLLQACLPGTRRADSVLEYLVPKLAQAMVRNRLGSSDPVKYAPIVCHPDGDVVAIGWYTEWESSSVALWVRS